MYFASSLLEFLHCFCDSFLLATSSSLAFQPGGEWKVQSMTSSGPLTPCPLVERSEVCLSRPEDANDGGLSQLDTDFGLLFTLLPPSLSPPPPTSCFLGFV